MTQNNCKAEVLDLLEILAELYKDPSEEIWEPIKNHMLQQEMDLRMDSCGIVKERMDWPDSLLEMSESYNATLGGPAAPIESLYKPWTADKTCMLPFARSKGYLLGDSSFHIKYIQEQFGMEIPAEYKNKPDHLAILLEMLVFFIRHASPQFTGQFVRDHFDWIGDLQSKIQETSDQKFYLQVTTVLSRVIDYLKESEACLETL